MSLYSSNPNPEYGFLIVADHGKVIVAKVEFQLSPNIGMPFAVDAWNKEI